jgi:GTP-binding protein HflX
MQEGHVTVDAVEESCVLVGVITSEINEETAKEHLDELQFLAETAGAITVETFTQKLPYPNPRTYVGTGKLEEIRQYIKAANVELVIFDDELSPSQLRNIERDLDCKVLDRTILILDIFASRARTFHAKTQVELAQLQYMLPRLTRMWTHLERQKGGIGLRGPGESQIETDRRIIQMRISLMKERLKDIDKQIKEKKDMIDKLVKDGISTDDEKKKFKDLNNDVDDLNKQKEKLKQDYQSKNSTSTSSPTSETTSDGTSDMKTTPPPEQMSTMYKKENRILRTAVQYKGECKLYF